MAALIKQETGMDADLVEGGRGEFTVWVGKNVVSQKDSSGFPEDAVVLSAVQHALASV